MVASWGKKMPAQEAAHRVEGVLDVANDITVKPAGGQARTDVDIARAVRSTLGWDVFVPDERIRSTVSANDESKPLLTSRTDRRAEPRLRSPTGELS